MQIPKASRKLEHGKECWCGTCGAPGKWDDMQHDPSESNRAVFENAIWYNEHVPHEEGTGRGGIECYECWLK